MKDKKEIDYSKLIEFFLNPGSYPHKPGSVEHLQTHASHIFIASPYVYKVKKPVNLGFLDFSTLDRRRYYCEKEVELNRRLCNDVYLGVEEISLHNDSLAFGKGDRTVEYAVKMKELPERYFLKNLLKEGRVTRGDLSRLVEKLVEFYRRQSTDKDIVEYGRPGKIKINMDENFSGSKSFTGKTISSAAYDAIKFYSDLFFEKKSPVFLKRIEKGFIKDCHGDLHLEHINLNPQGICIYDCIEFNERFRYIDIASDIAFLAMDLDLNGYSDFADFVVSEISRRMEDRTIFGVINFYKCYRAYVRGKVESIKSEEPEVSQRDREVSQEKAKRYFRLALRYALFSSNPAVIVVFGLIGSGKSTIAGALSEKLSCEVISSDAVRKEIMGVKPTERKYEGFDKGIYSEDVTDMTYREMIHRARRAVESGKSVILDASFSKRKFRKAVVDEAESLGVPFYFVETKASMEIIRERLLKREKMGRAVSDGRWEIFERFKEDLEEPDELPKDKYLIVSTDKNMEETLSQTFGEIINRSYHLRGYEALEGGGIGD